MPIYNIKNTSVADVEKKYTGNFGGDVHFIMGPLSIYQFNQFAIHGLCAVRLFQYIRTKQGLVYGHRKEFKGKDTSNKWVYIDNKNLYEWFGLHQPTKWKLLKELSDPKVGLLEYQKRGSGRIPLVRIKAPKKKLN